jgi:hypothetical protein
MRILVWNLYGPWTSAFVHGDHHYFVPVVAERNADGLGRLPSYPWPEEVNEITPEQVRENDFDLVILQRERDEFLFEKWSGRKVGRDVPAIWVEQDCPREDVPWARHPASDRTDIRLVHVSHFNSWMWDTGSTETHVIEHGIVDPGDRWTGELARCAVVSNNPVRRGRLVGTDLLSNFTHIAPVDLFGMNASALPETLGARSIGIAPIDELPQALLHHEISRRRLYLHLPRWTSLGFSLIEAMHLGMPVVALGTTETWMAVKPEFGFVSTRIEDLQRGVRDLINDHSLALEMGARARDFAREQYGLTRFLSDWDRLIKEVVS